MEKQLEGGEASPSQGPGEGVASVWCLGSQAAVTVSSQIESCSLIENLLGGPTSLQSYQGEIRRRIGGGGVGWVWGGGGGVGGGGGGCFWVGGGGVLFGWGGVGVGGRGWEGGGGEESRAQENNRYMGLVTRR